MPGKKVAVEGEATATVGTSPFSGAESGTWTAGNVSTTSYSNLKAGGKAVIWKATCTFGFSGASSSGATVTGSEPVTVAASTKLLNKAQHAVLVDGDQAEGTYGNKLKASAAGLLLSA